MATVLITGASSGIGKDLADIFASKKNDLILVARSKETLHNMAVDFEQRYGTRVNVFDIDLSQPGSAVQLYNGIKDIKTNIDILINNAGVGMYGDAVDMEVEKVSHMLMLNIASVTELSLLFAHDMKEARRGKILNISSTAAFQPTPYLAAYGASKAYVLQFGEALHIELKKYGVTVVTVCPGPTETGFAKGANMEHSTMFKAGVMSSKHVAKGAYNALQKNRMTAILGLKNILLATSVRFFPRSWIASIGGKMMK